MNAQSPIILWDEIENVGQSPQPARAGRSTIAPKGGGPRILSHREQWERFTFSWRFDVGPARPTRAVMPFPDHRPLSEVP